MRAPGSPQETHDLALIPAASGTKIVTGAILKLFVKVAEDGATDQIVPEPPRQDPAEPEGRRLRPVHPVHSAGCRPSAA